LTDKQLRELKRKINEHLFNEAQIVEDMIKADFSNEEWKEVTAIILNHPYTEVLKLFKKNREIRQSSKARSP